MQTRLQPQTPPSDLHSQRIGLQRRFIEFAEDVRARVGNDDPVSIFRAFLEGFVRHTTVYRGFAASLGLVLKTGTSGSIAITSVGWQLLQTTQENAQVRGDVTFENLVCVAMAIPLSVEQSENHSSCIAQLVGIFTESVFAGVPD